MVWLGIKNYEPRFMRNTAEVISQYGKTLRKLHGKTLKGIYVLWNTTLDDRYKDAPVILLVDEVQVELCANKDDLFSITINTIDRSLDVEPLDLGEIGVWNFEWRSVTEQHVFGSTISDIEVIEYKFSSTILLSQDFPNDIGREQYRWLLHGIGFQLGTGYLAVFNALDENDITFRRRGGEDIRYINI